MAVTMEEVQALVGLQLGKRKVLAEDRFMEDLGAESADLLNIITAAEAKYDISFDETDISKVRTVWELHDLIKSFCGGPGGNSPRFSKKSPLVAEGKNGK